LGGVAGVVCLAPACRAQEMGTQETRVSRGAPSKLEGAGRARTLPRPAASQNSLEFHSGAAADLTAVLRPQPVFIKSSTVASGLAPEVPGANGSAEPEPPAAAAEPAAAGRARVTKAPRYQDSQESLPPPSAAMERYARIAHVRSETVRFGWNRGGVIRAAQKSTA